MASTACKILTLVLIGVVSADYSDELQAPSSNRLSFPTFNGGGAPGSRNGNRGFNGNGVAGGGFPGTGSTSGTYGGSTAGTGGLTGSGSNLNERFGSGATGFGSAGSGSNRFGAAGSGSNRFGAAGSESNGFGAAGFRYSVIDPITALGEAIGGGGVPGEDYPILSSVPITGFSCEGQLPGYYADTSDVARCQVFHICQDGDRIDSFLCPNGTIFNQQYFVCDWWYNFDCSTAEQFYGLNALIGRDVVGGGGGGGSSGVFNGNGFGSASTLQGTFSSLSNRNALRGFPSTQYGAPDRSHNNNGIRSRGNQNGRLVNTSRRNTFGEDRFGSASDQRGSFSALNGAPSSNYGAPGVGNGNLGASSTQNVVLSNGNRNTGKGNRNGGFNGSNIRAPSGLYQTPSK